MKLLIGVVVVLTCITGGYLNDGLKHCNES